jgi:hypothetical protein
VTKVLAAERYEASLRLYEILTAEDGGMDVCRGGVLCTGRLFLRREHAQEVLDVL